MTIEQTVEIPASRRITFDLPLTFPVGKVIVALVVFPENLQPVKRETAETLCGAARDSKLTLERFMDMQREEIDLELENDKRLWTNA
jgi:hypothetical protein